MKRSIVKITCIAGTRPNFIKVAPLINALNKVRNFKTELAHTGQHYDSTMSEIFFKELNIKKPEINIYSGSGSHSVQTGRIMTGLEKRFLKSRPDLVIVVGDVNSTLAAALVTSKLHIPLAHVEAGLRSFDLTMPEEINRIVTDRLSDYLFTPSPDANENLVREGIDSNKVFFTGNIMIDTLVKFNNEIKHKDVLRKYELKKNEFCFLTLHRPSNVDNKKVFKKIAIALKKISGDIKIVFPAHPRSLKKMKEFILKNYFNTKNIVLTEPIGYLDTIALVSTARFVITDSGGLQEETTYLNVPCLTLRENTERPVTSAIGTNTVIGTNTELLMKMVTRILSGNYKKGKRPKFWDGNTAGRIANILRKKFS
ncbi:MAG: UDP-N-acetylglucosamine 2-epimerase (non-hydrolyzing) [Chlorobi bacterium]|nr:UDP-N-acetylglucosamine 2-epimerase (non-hydrolyzing) [Chlorobiota bacterium]